MKTIRAISILMLILWAAAPGLADQVVLRDGGVIQGRVVDQTQDTITVRDIDGIETTYDMKRVDSVIRESRGLPESNPGTDAANAAMPALVIQNGHALQINAMAFSPDGKYLASAGSDGLVKIWDASTFELIRNIKAESGEINAISFSPNGGILATAGQNGTVRLWRADTGELVRTLAGHPLSVQAVAFSPDGNLLASGSVDTSVKLWNPSTGELIRTITGNPNRIEALAFGADGAALAAAAAGRVILWNPLTGDQLRGLPDIGTDVQCLAVSPDGNTLAAGAWDGMVYRWNQHTGETLTPFEGHTSIVMALAFSPDGARLASAGQDGSVIIQSASTGEAIATLHGHTSAVGAVAFSPDGNTLASGGWDRVIRIRSAADFSILATLSGHSDYPYSVAVSPDGTTLVSGMWNQTISIWDLTQGEPAPPLTGHGNSVHAVAFSPDGKLLASGGYDSAIKIWSMPEGAPLHSLKGHEGFVESVAFSPDGTTLASGSADNTIKLWNPQTGALLQTLTGHSARVNSVAFSPDGATLASGTEDRTVRLWNTSDGKLARVLTGHTADVHAVAFSPDGKLLVSASGRFGADNTVRLWDTATGNLVQTFEGHTDMVLAAAFSPDGKTIASGGVDGVIILWDGQTRTRAQTLRGHEDAVDSLAFSPDGDLLYSGSWDTTLKIWNAHTGQILATLIEFDDGNWFVQDRVGRFDCSNCTRGGQDTGKQYIRWRADNRLYNPDQFFRTYFEPGLLADVVKLGAIPAEEDMGSALQAAPPEIRITDPGNGGSTDRGAVTVTVRIDESRGGGADSVRLFVNGRPVASPPREQPAPAHNRQWIYSFTAPLTPGPNMLTALATSRSGIDSREAQITVTSTAPAQKPGLFLLTVGINTYANSDMNLILAVEDADAFADDILSHGKTLFSEIHDIRLRNETATTEDLRAALDQIRAQATFNDQVIIYYAGHGANYGKTRALQENFIGGWFLLTHDISVATPQYISEHAFSDLELKAFMKKVRAGKVILVMDSCFSGAISQTFSYGVSRDKNLLQLAYGSGATVLAAATAQQEAQATQTLGHGLFTYFLLDGMSGKADGTANGSKDHIIQARELGAYTLEQVPEYTKANHLRKQVPFFWQTSDAMGLGPDVAAAEAR